MGAGGPNPCPGMCVYVFLSWILEVVVFVHESKSDHYLRGRDVGPVIPAASLAK